jgi:hypothetical protein
MPAPTDYTDLDYASLRARLVALASSAFPDVDWTAAASLEVLLLELSAYVGDVIAYYLNNVGRESKWGTAQQRRSLLRLVKLIGYKPPGAVAAQYVETFTLATAPANPVTFPAGTVVQTSTAPSAGGPVLYQILAPLTIPAGQTAASGTVENSVAASDAFSSTGLADQTFILSSTPYLDGSAVVVAADGTYVEVQNFLASGPTDRHFTTSVDDLDRCTVAFGDATNGAIPSGTITVAYKTGGGAAGNVLAGAINQIPGNFADTSGAPVRVSVTNGAATVQGVDRASAAQIRALAPESLRVLGRAVAREDFEIGARAVPGVARALCLTANEDPSIGENSGRIFIVPNAGGAAPSGLLSLVLAQFNGPTAPYPCLLTFQLAAQTATYLPINVSTQVYIRKGYTPATVGADIRQRLTDYFALTITPARLWQLAPGEAASLGVSQIDVTSQILNPVVDFGYELQDEDGAPVGSYGWSDMFDLIGQTSGVLRVVATMGGLLLNGYQSDVPINNFQFPMLGTVAIVNATDGSAL